MAQEREEGSSTQNLMWRESEQEAQITRFLGAVRGE